MKIPIKKSAVSAVMVAGLLLVFSISAHAQVRALRGKVTDGNGEPVVGATINIEATDVYRKFPPVKTDKKGEYYQILGNNQTGIYRMVIRKEGYSPTFKENLRPEIGEELITDFKLEPGNEKEKFLFEMSAAEKKDYEKRLAQNEENKKQREKWSKEVAAHVSKGNALFDEGKYDDALLELNKALEGLPELKYQSGVLARVGDIYLKTDRNDEAVEVYDKIITVDPGNASVYAQKGVALGRLGKTAESQEMFKKSAELDPKNAAKNFYNMGVTMFNSDDMGKAVDAFKQSIEADSNYSESYYMLGMSLLNDESMIPEAVAAFKKYVSIGKRADQLKIAKEMISTFE